MRYSACRGYGYLLLACYLPATAWIGIVPVMPAVISVSIWLPASSMLSAYYQHLPPYDRNLSIDRLQRMSLRLDLMKIVPALPCTAEGHLTVFTAQGGLASTLNFLLRVNRRSQIRYLRCIFNVLSLRDDPPTLISSHYNPALNTACTFRPLLHLMYCYGEHEDDSIRLF
jgi:hypothetical protein